jgi:hypothetical protein
MNIVCKDPGGKNIIKLFVYLFIILFISFMVKEWNLKQLCIFNLYQPCVMPYM